MSLFHHWAPWGQSVWLQAALLCGGGLLLGRAVRRYGPEVIGQTYRATLFLLGLTVLIQVFRYSGVPVFRSLASTKHTKQHEEAHQTNRETREIHEKPKPPPSLVRNERQGKGAGGLGKPEPPKEVAEGERLGVAEGGRLGVAGYAPTAYCLLPTAFPMPLFLALWTGGGLFLACRLLWRQRTLKRLLRRATPLQEEATLATLDSLCRARGVQVPRVVRVEGVVSPFLAGSFRPTLVLPATYHTDFTPSVLAAILAHEVQHLTRRDPAWRFLAQLLCILLWPQPLTWLLAKSLDHINDWRLDFQGGFFSHLLFCFALGTGLFDHFIANHRLYHRSQRPTRRFSTRLGRTRRRS